MTRISLCFFVLGTKASSNTLVIRTSSAIILEPSETRQLSPRPIAFYQQLGIIMLRLESGRSVSFIRTGLETIDVISIVAKGTGMELAVVDADRPSRTIKSCSVELPSQTLTWFLLIFWASWAYRRQVPGRGSQDSEAEPF